MSFAVGRPKLAAAILVVAFALLHSERSRAEEESVYQKAQAAIVRGAWNDTLTITGSILQSNPRDLKALNLQGLALTGKGDTLAANQTFEECLRFEPGFYPARKNLAVNQLHLHQAAESERNFDLVLAAEPNDAVANMYKGELAFARKDFAAAAEHISRAGPWLGRDVRLHVMAAECNYQLEHEAAATGELDKLALDKLEPDWQFRAGVLLAEHDQFGSALRYFEALHGSRPESYDVAFNLSLCYVETKRFGEAIALLNAFRGGGHKTSELDNLLAEAYNGDGKTQQAIDILREATTLAPQDERNYLDLAILCADHKAFGLALEVLDVGLHRLPVSNALWMQRGIVYAMAGKFDLAEKDFQHVGQSESEKDAAAVGLGLVYIQQGELAQATEALRQRIRKDPDNAALQYLLAESLIRSGAHPGDDNFPEAQRALQQSVRLNPQFVYSRVDLAKTYLEQGQTTQAIEELKAALKIDSSKVQIYAQLAVALRRQGNTGEASAMFAKVRELNDQTRRRGELAPLIRGPSLSTADSTRTVP